MNFDKYRLELTKENIDKRIVGGRKIEAAEAEKAQQCQFRQAI